MPKTLFDYHWEKSSHLQSGTNYGDRLLKFQCRLGGILSIEINPTQKVKNLKNKVSNQPLRL